MKIKYKAGYRYQLSETYSVETLIFGEEVKTPFIELSETGRLTVKEGYSWDGPSGPAVDTKNFMRGSLVHDAGYQLIREGYLTQTDRLYFDQLLRKMVREDGMSALRAWWVYHTLRVFGGKAARKGGGRKVQEAP